ncbi:uncharacterized protein [Lolium perenne]|uniref:uncharacterized protein n=1 Tax=Lolium perenne TaxID=4522 RepID=UPI003A99C9E4
MAALMDEELAVAAATRDAAGDDEHLAILVSLLAMIAEEYKPFIGGSASGRRKSKPRQRMEGYRMLYADYFADDPLHGDTIFRHHFRMSRKLFLKIVENLREIDYFKLKRDAVNSTTIDCMYRFYKAIVVVFGETYLRTPTDTTRILAQNSERDFPRMLVSSCKC